MKYLKTWDIEAPKIYTRVELYNYIWATAKMEMINTHPYLTYTS